jgi:phage-related protein
MTPQEIVEEAAPASQESNLPLFAQNDAQDFRARWDKIQAGFVDEPRKSVEQADELVASAIKRLADVFASERQKLESEWDKTDNVSTEDLRVALRRYRSFFTRLLAV